jgi:hypothetical protein
MYIFFLILRMKIGPKVFGRIGGSLNRSLLVLSEDVLVGESAAVRSVEVCVELLKVERRLRKFEQISSRDQSVHHARRQIAFAKPGADFTNLRLSCNFFPKNGIYFTKPGTDFTNLRIVCKNLHEK